MIRLDSLSLQRGPKFLLENASLTVHSGQKVGLIGANGSGKSSLFKLLLGELHEDAGSLHLPPDWRIAHMAQEVGDAPVCALDYVLDGDAELRALQARINEAEGPLLAQLFEQLQHIDGYSAEARAQKLLSGLGFKPGDAARAVTDFSGGWRIRLNLARALMCRSDLLLLDEPTNHLDLDACYWLENWLRLYPGTLLIISHDRDFLDNVVDITVHLDQRCLTSYAGNYSAFERQRAERLAQQSIAFEKQQQRIAEIDQFVRRFKAKASKAKQAQSRLKELERMERIAPAHVDSPFSFRFPVPDKLPQTLLTLDELAIGYTADAPTVSAIQMSILSGSRIGLLGHNGAGKSTLIKSIAGTIPVLGGERIEAAQLNLGYYAQHQLEALDLEASPVLHIQRMSPRASEQDIRNFLGSFGFHGERALEEVRDFSGGEKARVALALLAWQKPNLLVLDEPTNHLDLEVRHALTLALQAYDGALLIVSHDRHLLRNTVDAFYLVDEGRLTEFDGDLADYERWLSQRRDASTDNAPAIATEKHIDKKERRQNNAERRAKEKTVRAAISKLEKQMEREAGRLSALERELADTALYESERKSELQEKLKLQAQLRSELEFVELEWLEKSEMLEALKAGSD